MYKLIGYCLDGPDREDLKRGIEIRDLPSIKELKKFYESLIGRDTEHIRYVIYDSNGKEVE